MSHEVTRIIPKKERCEFCHRKATLLCDMPVAEVCTSIDFKSYVRTCDKNLCEKCTTRVGVFDFCPACIKKIKSAKKGLNVDFGGKMEMDYMNLCDDCLCKECLENCNENPDGCCYTCCKDADECKPISQCPFGWYHEN